MFTATDFEPDSSGGGRITGTLTLAGRSQPIQLGVTRTGQDSYRVTTSIVQSQHGIKPYSGFLGALKVSDEVAVEVEVGPQRSG